MYQCIYLKRSYLEALPGNITDMINFISIAAEFATVFCIPLIVACIQMHSYNTRRLCVDIFKGAIIWTEVSISPQTLTYGIVR